jgi:hypothetical protein
MSTQAYDELLENIREGRTLEEGLHSKGLDKSLLRGGKSMREGRETLSEYTNRAMGVVPTQEQQRQVSNFVKQLPMKPVARDFGYVAGKYLSDVLEMAGMKPSDYVNLQDLSEHFIGRFLHEINNNEELKQVFVKYFLEQLSLRG